MKCEICQTEQNQNSKYCSNCGAALRPIQNIPFTQYSNNFKNNFKVFGAIIILIIIFIVYSKISTNKNDEDFNNTKLTLRSDQIKYLEELQTEGYISIEAELNKVYISPDLWYGMDAKLKEDFAASLSIYCGNKKGTELYWVEIYDKQSAKRLAKYSKSWGFDIY